MRPRFRLHLNSLLVILAMLLPSCQPAPSGPASMPVPTLATETLLPTSSSLADPTEQDGVTPPLVKASPQPPTFTPQPEALPLSRYILKAELNYGMHHVQVEQAIHYVNRSGEPIPDLRLMVEPMGYPGVFRLEQLKWGDGQDVKDYAWENTQMRIPLAKPLLPGERVDLELSYEMDLPSPQPSAEYRPIPFGYTARQTNLVDWYPFIPPYVAGKGWLAHPPGYYGEHLAYEAADFDVSLRIADARPDLTVAASAAAQADAGDGWRRYTLEAARNFVFSLSNQYVMETETVGEVTVIGYHFPFHPTAGKATLRTTVDALKLYSELFGPYPRKQLSVVEADFLDGMEYDGLYFLSNGFYNLYQGTQGEYLIAIAAHETAHQWWYALVGNDQGAEPWLDEALCTYSELLYYTRLHPEALQWWWDYRVNYYGATGWVDATIYNTQGFTPYRNAVYLNGAVFLNELSKQVGEDVFLDFLKDYVAAYSHQIATGDDFFVLLAKHTPANFSPLVDQYFSNR